jgi:hypothetical protein
MSETTHQQHRSLKVFKQAPSEIQDLVKLIMEKERQEQHKRARTEIYQTLLQFIKESTH